MIRIAGDPVSINRIYETPRLPFLTVTWTDQPGECLDADVVLIGDVTKRDLAEMRNIIRRGFYRHVAFAPDVGEVNDIAAAVTSTGAAFETLPYLPKDAASLYPQVKLQRGSLIESVRGVMATLASWRTIWRYDDSAAILEWPKSGEPILRSLEISEFEILLDAVGVQSDDQYLMARVACAVHAGITSWVPPASGVGLIDDPEMLGYDPESETIFLELEEAEST